MSMGKQITLGLLILLLLLFSVLFNKSIIDIRLGEIDYHLNRVALEDQASRTFSIISRYELIKNRIEFGESHHEDYDSEGRIQVLLATDSIPQLRAVSTEMSWWHPVRLTLAGMRFLLGKEQVGTQEVEKAVEELERAYLLERQRQYVEALALYDSILTKPSLSPKIEASLLMHKAFCLSLLSNYDESAEMYERVVTKYAYLPEGALSARLLEFIQSLQEEKSSVKEVSKDKHELGKKLYTYMDYRGAIKELNTYLESASPVQKKSAHFYKGRAHEELGEYISAVDEYQTVLTIDRNSAWAQKANRRLVMLGNFYEQKSTTITEARKELVRQGDTLFVQKVEALSKIVEDTKRERRKSALPSQSKLPHDTVADSRGVKDSVRIRDSIRSVDSLARVDSLMLDSITRFNELRMKDSIASADSLAKIVERKNRREAREKERLNRERIAAAQREQRRKERLNAKKREEERLRREKEQKELEKMRAEEVRRRQKEAREKRVRERKAKLAASEFRNSAYIKSTIEKNIPSFKKLYLKYAQTGEPVTGKIVVEMEISASGSIKAKVANSTIGNRDFQRDMIRQIESWRFPAVDRELGTMRIKYPFRFKQQVTGK